MKTYNLVKNNGMEEDCGEYLEECKGMAGEYIKMDDIPGHTKKLMKIIDELAGALRKIKTGEGVSIAEIENLLLDL